MRLHRVNTSATGLVIDGYVTVGEDSPIAGIFIHEHALECVITYDDGSNVVWTRSSLSQLLKGNSAHRDSEEDSGID